ncbi:MAG TPA: PBS lyase [Coriobacteriia bacterium]|nr:PBS lyase [Coriobacteriia bacterium]
MGTLQSLEERIRTYALEIGYSAAGFAPADDFDEYIDIINDAGARYDWWKNGAREPMAWARPAQKLAGTKSLIVLIYNSAQVRFPAELCEKLGRIYQARCYFAQPGNINHARLELMRGFLADLGMQSTDAPWLPQRWAAQRSGLASFGKNTFAYASGLGSFIVITTLLVDRELNYDEPCAVSTCPEDCTLCIDACPTKALGAPFELDPRRCIAFNNWMPQVSVIPREMRPLLGQRIHGCDYCQEACPRNKQVLENNEKRPKDSLLELLVKEIEFDRLLHLSAEYYEQWVRPVMYNYITNLRLFQRNAAVAIGNSHDVRYLPDLARELSSESELVRAHVAWALGEIAGEEARHLLQARLVVEEDESVRQEIVAALA